MALLLTLALAGAPTRAAEGKPNLTVLLPKIAWIVSQGQAEAATWSACLSRDTPDAAEDMRKYWHAERDLIVATLWATDLSDSYARYLESSTTLDPSAPPPAEQECIDFIARVEVVGHVPPHARVWTEMAAAGIDFGAIKPMTPEALAKVEAAFAEVLPQQAIALRCTALEDAGAHGRAVADWRSEITDIRALLHDVGWPHPAIARLTLPADPNRLTELPAVAQKTKSDCTADRRWLDWLSNLGWRKARIEVEKILAEGDDAPASR